MAVRFCTEDVLKVAKFYLPKFVYILQDRISCGLLFFEECLKLIFTKSLSKNFQFKNVYNHGKSFADTFLVMYILKNNSCENYLGISVSKKVGKSVTRSRITRLIKENYRLNEKFFLPGFDIVFIARNPASTANFYEIKKSVCNLAKRHKIFFNS